MNILHTSDWHLGKSLESISRLDEQREFIDVLCTLVDSENIHLVIVAGDVFDTYNPSAAAEALFYDAIDRLSAKGKRAVLVIAGNHDNPERLCAASPLACKNGIMLLGYPGSDPGVYPVGGGVRCIASGAGWCEITVPGCDDPAVILTMPYPSESRLEEALVSSADETRLQKAYSERIGTLLAEQATHFRKDSVNLIVSHLFLMGGKSSDSERTLQVGGAMTVDPGHIPAGAHYVALGHLHRPQHFKTLASPVVYAGSPLAYSFSEAGQSKAVYIVQAQPGLPADIRPVLLVCGKPLCRWQASCIEEAMGWCEAGRDPHAWVDLEIETDRILTLEEQKKIRTLHPGIVNIRPRMKTGDTPDTAPERREGRKIDDLFREYYRHKTQNDMPDELMTTFLEILNGEEPGNETETA